MDGNFITQVFLPLSLAFIMFSVGLELTLGDFRKVATQPKGFLVGAASQMILLPSVAFILALIWDLPPALAVGVMIIAACPGGVTSNLMTYLSRADTALSVSLTATISLLSVITLPLITGFSIAWFMGTDAPELSIGKSVIGIFLITTVPVILGMLVQHYAQAFARRFEKIARLIAAALFVVIIAGAIFAERHNAASYFAQAGSIALALNIIMMILAALIAQALALPKRQQTAITMECGLQNGTLAIFVALTLIGNRDMMIPGAIYSLVMFPTALLFMVRAMRQKV